MSVSVTVLSGIDGHLSGIVSHATRYGVTLTVVISVEYDSDGEPFWVEALTRRAAGFRSANNAALLPSGASNGMGQNTMPAFKTAR
jgi:hypothetical protein